MPICKFCGHGFDGPETTCPSCGALHASVRGIAPTGPLHVLSKVSLILCMGVSILGVLTFLIGGIVLLAKGELLQGVLSIVIMVPYSIGQFVVFRYVFIQSV